MKKRNSFLVKFYKKNTFGKVIKLPKSFDNASVVVICVNDNQGLQPVYLCLPHQVYKEKILALLDQYPGTRTVTIIPVDHKTYFDV